MFAVLLALLLLPTVKPCQVYVCWGLLASCARQPSTTVQSVRFRAIYRVLLEVLYVTVFVGETLWQVPAVPRLLGLLSDASQFELYIV